MSFTVRVGYDAEKQLYYVLSSDIPGLNIETGSFELFVEIAVDAAPDLVGGHAAGASIRFEREVELTI